jgi:hypothetical protein
MAVETRMINCVRCKQDFVVDVPAYEIVNAQKVSVVALIHPEIPCCPHCSQPYMFFITALRQIEYGWRAIELKKEESGIILPPSGFDKSKLQ